MKTLIKTFLIVFLASGICSCDIKKEASKTKNDIDFSEWVKTETFRKGDTVTFVVPNVIYKDTVITTVSTQGTILKTYYDNKGNISKSDCISSEMALIQERLTKLTDQSKTKESSKEEKIDNTFIYVIAGAIVLMFLIVIIALFIYLKSQSNKFNLLLSNLPK